MLESGKFLFVLIAFTLLSLGACGGDSIEENAKDLLGDIIVIQAASLEYFQEVSGVPTSIEHLIGSGYLNADKLIKPWGEYLIHKDNTGFYVGIQLTDTTQLDLLERYISRISYLSEYGLALTPLFTKEISEIKISDESPSQKIESNSIGVRSNFALLQ